MVPRRKRSKLRGVSHSLPESWREIVADTSAIINLNATGRAAEILALFASPPVVTESVRFELQAGRDRGHQDIVGLEALVRHGACRIVEIGKGATIQRSLVEGRTKDTLGDGEAATVAYAAAYGRAAMMDDKKARRICEERFPATRVVSTAELLLHPAVKRGLGEDGQADAIVAALQRARMSVPRERVADVVALIGKDRAASCASLPASARQNAERR